MKKLLISLLCVVMVISCTLPAVSALTPHGTGIRMRNWLTNDPNYDFSDAYKTSVWYENFTSLELTQNERNNVLRIAVSQLGYHEGNSAADFNGMNTGGNQNYIEYARLLIPHYNDNHYEWCACFVNWCLNQARIDRYSSEIGCWKWVGELKAMKYWQDSPAYNGTYTPLPADMIFFNWKHAESKNNASGHIGYVLYTTETHVYTIEGNADNNVTVRSYALSDPSIIGYGTPDYKENNEPTIDYAYKDGMPFGYYVVNGSNVGLLQSPDSSRRIAKVGLGHRVLLLYTTKDHAMVKYGDKEGFLPKNVLYYLQNGPDVTVTYDANGGQNPPKAQTVNYSQVFNLTSEAPTLEGDKLLGWSTRPYDTAPMYLAGSDFSLTEDLTLYAVWEKHSETLAAAAMADGILVNFRRPAQTYHPRAVLASDIDPQKLTPSSDTEARLVQDDYAQYLMLQTSAASTDPYITIPYADIMKSRSLSIANASDIKYVVFHVLNQSLSSKKIELFYNCDTQTDDKTAPVVSATLATLDIQDYEYVVFDMSQAKGWDGNIQSLRLDYEDSAEKAGERIYIFDFFLLVSDEELEAVTKQNFYPFAAAEKVEYPDETEDDTNTEQDTSAGGTSAEQGTQTNGTSAEQGTQANTSEQQGCSSAVSMGLLPTLILGAVAMIKRRRHD